jgi:uncharacterized protein YybS (DUF2232 family)
MNLIKHIANLLALWTIPYVIVLFFLLVTGFAFVYQDAISSTPYIIAYTLYFIMMLILYVSGDDKDFDSIKLFKTN